MSRYVGKNNIAGPILEAAEHWKQNSLLSDKGIFEDKEIWKIDYFEELNQYLIKRLDKNKDKFPEKLETLLEARPPEIKQLAAEIWWLMFLCADKYKIQKKREDIKTIWKRSGKPFPENSKWLEDDVLAGIAHIGAGIFSRLAWEWEFFVLFIIELKKMPVTRREELLLSSGWEFAEYIEKKIPESATRQSRHMILFLLFPDNFERIFSGKDKKKIVEAFTGKPVGKMSILKIDQLIFDIRRRKEKEHGNSQLDFYNDPLEKEWKYPEPNPFPWIPFYESIAEKLLDFRNKRENLVGKIHEIADRFAIGGYKDKFKDGNTGPLKDVCPFTTIGVFSRGKKKFEDRKIIAAELANSLGLSEPAPDAFDGIPVVPDFKSWFFPFEKDRQSDDIDTLWEVFDRAISFAESEDTDSRSAFAAVYNKALEIKGVAWNLTMGLYWIRPWFFPTLDEKSQKYIKNKLHLEIPNQTPDAENYLEIRDTLKTLFQEDDCPVHSFPELALAAWVSPPAPAPAPAPDNPTPQSNLILYGPPGTGKTYRLNKLTEKYSSIQQTLTRKTWLIQELSEASWFEVIFVTLYDLGKKEKVSAISEHEYVQAKAESIGRVKHVKNTIWAVLQSHAPENSKTVRFKNRGKTPTVFDKDKNSVWSLVDDWEEECQEQIELANKWKAGPHKGSIHQRFEFVTFHQAYGYEDFVEGIRPVLDEETGSVRYEVVPGVFKRICRRAKADPDQRYAIFIDEINRGNIASIFGELITLLETDKRVIYGEDGSPESGMMLTLPYSGEKFGVPANLDVYGTMNTADRSIALLDTALRRRFQFQELMPDSSLINGSSGDGFIEDGTGGTINLRALLEAINSRIRFLLSRDMTIGHSYLINVHNFDELKNVLLFRIIPLLQEYFYDDWHRIQLVFRDVKTGGEKPEPHKLQIIKHKILEEKKVIGFDHDDFENSTEYQVAPEDEITPDAIRKIYEEKTTPDV
ncbi:MAG: AAA family ATPase [Candidatus Dadabacteria bacterium]|nr:AAA family ATPase [Candidatus Dadabacteria bacterium]